MVPVPALLTNLLCMFVFVSCDCVQTVDSNSQAFIAKVKKKLAINRKNVLRWQVQ